jgi:hypothetical protein
MHKPPQTRSQEELAAMSSDDLADYIAAWRNEDIAASKALISAGYGFETFEQTEARVTQCVLAARMVRAYYAHVGATVALLAAVEKSPSITALAR